MPKLDQFAGRDVVRTATVTLTPPGSTEKIPLSVGFYPNRLTMEPNTPNGVGEPEWVTQSETPQVTRQAWLNVQNFKESVANWDLEGELRDHHGGVVVPDGEVVPIEAETLLCLPTWIITQITEKLLDLSFPNRPSSNAARRR